MMLPTDVVLLQDKKFKKWVRSAQSWVTVALDYLWRLSSNGVDLSKAAVIVYFRTLD